MPNESSPIHAPTTWDKYAAPDLFDPKRLGYGHYFYTPLERFYEKQLATLPSGIATALDVGCGNGQKLLHLLHSGTASKGTGIDVSTGAIEGAHKLAAYLDVLDRVEFEICEFSRFSSTERFDLVLAIQFINYQASLDVFFTKIAQLTQTGACVVVSDVQHDVESWTMKLRSNKTLRKWLGKEPVQTEDLVRHQYSDIIAAAKRNGFEEARSAFGFGIAPRLVGSWMYKTVQRDYSNSVRRVVIKRLYETLRSLWALEDFWRTKRGSGSLYWTLLQKK